MVTKTMPFKRKGKEISLELGVKKCAFLHICSAVFSPPAPPASIFSCWVTVGKKMGIISAVVIWLLKSHYKLIFYYYFLCKTKICLLFFRLHSDTDLLCLGASHQPALCFHSYTCTVETTLSFPKISLFG